MSNPIVVTNGNVIDGTGAEPIEGGTVVIEDGHVQQIGDVGEDEYPTDAKEIDASGKTVMPGIIEGHAHFGGKMDSVQTGRLSLQRGVTTICSVSANTKGIKYRELEEAGNLRGCSRLVAGAMVNPTNGHVRHRAADGPWEVRKAVREMKKEGHDFIKTPASGGFWWEDEHCSLRNYTREELNALADEAHAWDMPVVAHAHTQPGINNCIDAGIDQIHHGAFIDEEGVRGILENDLYFLPTLRVTCEQNIEGWPERPWMQEEMEESQPIHREGTTLAHELGVKIGVGSDYPGSAHAWRISETTMRELEELVLCGLSPLEAIRASAVTTAEAFRIDDELGTLEPGMIADLLIVDDDPLEDITIMQDPEQIQLVIKDGIVESADAAYVDHFDARETQPDNRPQDL